MPTVRPDQALSNIRARVIASDPFDGWDTNRIFVSDSELRTPYTVLEWVNIVPLQTVPRGEMAGHGLAEFWFDALVGIRGNLRDPGGRMTQALLNSGSSMRLISDLRAAMTQWFDASWMTSPVMWKGMRATREFEEDDEYRVVTVRDAYMVLIEQAGYPNG